MKVLNQSKHFSVPLTSTKQELAVTNFIVATNGANLEQQLQDFQDEFNAPHEKLKERMSLRGTYLQQDINTLMLEND